MSAAAGLTERYDPTRHDVAGFACGSEPLDRWLLRYAGQGERRDAMRTFVATGPGGVDGGYYTLLAGQVERAEATEAVRKGLSRHFPIPVAILARLAVDAPSEGAALGARLLTTRWGGYAEPRRKSPCERWSCMRSMTRRWAFTSASGSAASARRRGR